MEINAANQAYIFLIFIINGFIIGILFDIFRILRKTFKTPDLITYIEDLIFWLITGIITLYNIFKFNNGEIRIYIFIGIAIGLTVYIMTFSKHFMNLSVKIITIIKNIVGKILGIILYPIKLILEILKKTLFKPISFIFLNFRKVSTKFTKKITNIHLNVKNSKFMKKNTVQKKDFNV